ncbi:zinc carboxypeptidase, partial [candidate division WOR-3 bacterium]|nr:zinc carboxypeptidase [candidate division WOR-3 bacterium]
MRTLLLAGLLLALAGPVLALDRSGTIMEARVYFDNTRTLDRLGDLAGELDICTWDEDETGGYLVINTDAEQFEAIRACGLRVEVTWADIRDKFRFETGVDPDDLDAGRNFGCYLTYWEVEDTLNWLATTYPDICWLTNVGYSHQGRQLYCLKISDNPASAEDEPACFFNGATHAREPTGTHTVVMFAQKLLSEYGNDPVATWLVNNREMFIVPVMNPDGYVYNSDSGGASSNWRKNRRVIQSPYVGVDLNRNYGYKWGYDNSGSSPTPSSETYRGPSAFSEPATAAVRDFMNLNRFRTCMDYHTYGRYNMYPWGYTTSYPPERELLQEMADTFRVNNGYSSGNTGQISRVLYGCNGVSVDWEYSDTAGKYVTYAFTCELSTGFWTGWDNPSFVANEVNINIPNLYYLARVSGVYFEPLGVTVNDTTLGNGTGEVDPDETAELWFRVRNRAVHPSDSAVAVSATLRSDLSCLVVEDSQAGFPSVPRRSDADNQADQFRVRAEAGAQPGTVVPLTLELAYDDLGSDHATELEFEITIGDAVGLAAGPADRVPSASAFPNPATNRVNLELPATAPGARLRAYSSAGR